MKAKDFIIIGGAIALFYLYQKNKTKNSSVSTDTESQDEATPSGGGGGGGGMPIITMPIKTNPIPATPKPLTPKGGTTSGGEAIFTGVIPIRSTTNSVSSPITNISNPTVTAPQPAIIPAPSLTTEESLISGGIRPITNTRPNLSVSIN
jgi:hypothetical protein